DAAANIIVLGHMWGAASMWSTRVLKLDPKGQLVFDETFTAGSGGSAMEVGVTVDSAGNVLLTGEATGPVDFGCGPVARGACSVKRGPDGKHRASRSYGALGQVSPGGIRVNGAGHVVWAGAFKGTVDFGAGPLTSLSQSYDGFVAKLQP